MTLTKTIACVLYRTLRRTAPLLVLAAVCMPAYAWDCSKWHQSTDPHGECYVPPDPPSSQATAAQTQGQGQSQAAYGGASQATATGGTGGAGGNAQGGTASQTQTAAASATNSAQGGDASNAGNAQSVSESTNYPRQTPMAMAGFVQPTIPCATARNGGASSPVVGLAFGFSGHDKECDLREDARLLFAFGRPDLAVALLCKDAERFGLKDCAPVTAAAPKADPRYVTREELREVEKRLVQRGAGK